MLFKAIAVQEGFLIRRNISMKGSVENDWNSSWIVCMQITFYLRDETY